MTEKQTYDVHPSRWPALLTSDREKHFERIGVELVTYDIANHRYEDPEKHFAALYWLDRKRKSDDKRQAAVLRVGKWTLIVALLTLIATLISITASS